MLTVYHLPKSDLNNNLLIYFQARIPLVDALDPPICRQTSLVKGLVGEPLAGRVGLQERFDSLDPLIRW